MNILLLGGTQFLGRHVAEIASHAGHAVTLLNRGKTNPGLFPDLERITGDRTQPLGLPTGRRWDLVVDTSGYVPRIVGANAAQFRSVCDRYLFVSTISVYAPAPDGPSESSPVSTLEEPTEEITGATYGPLKALCEQEVRDAFGDQALIVRPGLIVGPHDPSDRFTYWPRRFARGGRVLAPGDPAAPVQLIDARDLATWMLHAASQGLGGTFNATGPATDISVGEVLDACARAVGSDATLEWVPDAFLLDREVAPWMGLPLWLPDDGDGLMRVNIDAALGAGLTFRSIEEIARDTWEWDAARGTPPLRGTGIEPDRERELLDEWSAAQNPA